MSLPDTHLDLGCGDRPRNPYQRTRLFGVDIREVPGTDRFESRAANLSVDPIPFDDDQFGSVSAFDFFEHVPRVLSTSDGRSTRLPFIEVMNEVWRVLAPGGRLYAVTPAYPRLEAFVDPTHVNFITDGTHRYFCGDEPMGRMYGFTGRFKVVRVDWVDHQADAFIGDDWPQRHAEVARRQARRNQPLRRFVRRLRQAVRLLAGKETAVIHGTPSSHLLWELEAVKPGH
ncbi:MAG: methyltransferase domain-containing protein [Rhizobacter sp.]|jgi:SAM-dependent methyltransferase